MKTIEKQRRRLVRCSYVRSNGYLRVEPITQLHQPIPENLLKQITEAIDVIANDQTLPNHCETIDQASIVL